MSTVMSALEAPGLSGREVPLAKSRALEVNREQWGIGAPAIGDERAEDDNLSLDRIPTEAEIWSLLRLTSKLGVSESNIPSYLETLGYFDALNKVTAKRLAEARNGILKKPDWVQVEEESAALLDKSSQTEKSALKLSTEASSLREKVQSELRPQLAKAVQEKTEAETAAKTVSGVSSFPQPCFYRPTFDRALYSAFGSGAGCRSAEQVTRCPRQQTRSLQ